MKSRHSSSLHALTATFLCSTALATLEAMTSSNKSMNRSAEDTSSNYFDLLRWARLKQYERLQEKHAFEVSLPWNLSDSDGQNASTPDLLEMSPISDVPLSPSTNKQLSIDDRYRSINSGVSSSKTVSSWTRRGNLRILIAGLIIMCFMLLNTIVLFIVRIVDDHPWLHTKTPHNYSSSDWKHSNDDKNLDKSRYSSSTAKRQITDITASGIDFVTFSFVCTLVIHPHTNDWLNVLGFALSI